MNTQAPSQSTSTTLDAARLPVDAERLATAIVGAQLCGLLADAQDACSPADIVATLRPSHGRWLEATLRHLENHGLYAADAQTQRGRFFAVEALDALWSRWDEAMRTWSADANHRAYLALVEACLRRLPQILTGAVPATNVMFPESSMHLVEGIYKHNLIADHFNLVLCERLLEIGAGTGCTTAVLLRMPPQPGWFRSNARSCCRARSPRAWSGYGRRTGSAQGQGASRSMSSRSTARAVSSSTKRTRPE